MIVKIDSVRALKNGWSFNAVIQVDRLATICIVGIRCIKGRLFSPAMTPGPRQYIQVFYFDTYTARMLYDALMEIADGVGITGLVNTPEVTIEPLLMTRTAAAQFYPNLQGALMS